MEKFCCKNEKIKEIKLIDLEKAERLSDFFKIMSEISRIRILYALKECELCVHDLSIIVNMEQSAVSHQLKFLKKYNILTSRREGKMIIYSLKESNIFKVLDDVFDYTSH